MYYIAVFIYLFIHLVENYDTQTKLYEVLPGLRLDNSYKTIIVNPESMSKCAFLCLNEKNCSAANYNKMTYLCELNSKSPSEESSVVQENVDWNLLYIKDGE